MLVEGRSLLNKVREGRSAKEVEGPRAFLRELNEERKTRRTRDKVLERLASRAREMIGG